MDTETRELSSVSRGKIKPQETDDWKNEKLFVPPLPPTNLRGCHLIRIQYDVFVSTYSAVNMLWTEAQDKVVNLCSSLWLLPAILRNLSSFSSPSCWPPTPFGTRTGHWGESKRSSTRQHFQYSGHGLTRKLSSDTTNSPSRLKIFWDH